MEDKGESPKIENSGEQNVSDSAKEWESVKEVEFAGNDSARDKFYERYYKDHQEEIHKLVQDFLDQKMAEEEEHHAEEMTRIVETQTDGWTEEDSRKLHETSEKTEEKVEEKTEEKAEEPEKAEEAKEESAEQIVARMFEVTHQDKQQRPLPKKLLQKNLLLKILQPKNQRPKKPPQRKKPKRRPRTKSPNLSRPQPKNQKLKQKSQKPRQKSQRPKKVNLILANMVRLDSVLAKTTTMLKKRLSSPLQKETS